MLEFRYQLGDEGCQRLVTHLALSQSARAWQPPPVQLPEAAMAVSTLPQLSLF